MKLITTLALIGLGIAAEAQQVLTIDECREMALKNNHEIKAAQSKTKGAEYTKKSYKANYLPSLTLNVIGAYSTFKSEQDINVPVIGELPVFKPGADFKPQTQAILQHLGNDAASQMWKAQNLAGYLFFPGMSGSMGLEVGPMLVAGLTLQQPIYMGGKIANASKMAGLAVEASEANETLT
ncbi:MAG: TolC family protein, partial [Bacteroidales bacterium]|nr:TolC family protein [Bacteroidales bacterium]